MLLVQLIQDLATQGISLHDLLPHWASFAAIEPGAHGFLHGFETDLWPDFDGLTAQLQGQQFDTDVFKATRNSVGSFIKAGKHWVFLAGLVAGYLLRAATSYGS